MGETLFSTIETIAMLTGIGIGTIVLLVSMDPPSKALDANPARPTRASRAKRVYRDGATIRVDSVESADSGSQDG